MTVPATIETAHRLYVRALARARSGQGTGALSAEQCRDVADTMREWLRARGFEPLYDGSLLDTRE